LYCVCKGRAFEVDDDDYDDDDDVSDFVQTFIFGQAKIYRNSSEPGTAMYLYEESPITGTQNQALNPTHSQLNPVRFQPYLYNCLEWAYYTLIGAYTLIFSPVFEQKTTSTAHFLRILTPLICLPIPPW
jgi:hypothetical protein